MPYFDKAHFTWNYVKDWEVYLDSKAKKDKKGKGPKKKKKGMNRVCETGTSLVP